ncbi:dTDP-4-dehydrorhamnose 3,5-epimerase [Deltaproteobacteria bacterium OttesenSCG-928-K17]|nr:dTDP-4-dehydrorhamnose 3,5-epimerase [Deltaproteobacteria bacterium OttesenSCG-928-K17]
MEYLEAIDGLHLFDIKTFSDDRGYFRESFVDRRFFEQAKIKSDFVQDNEVYSKHAYTLRGLHFQRKPNGQAKYVRVLAGSIFDVAVDLRKNSPTFGRWKSFILKAEEAQAVFVPEGFAHGYLTLSPETIVTYKVNNYYAPESEGGVIWNDAKLAINWPLAGNAPILSDKDLLLPALAEIGEVF